MMMVMCRRHASDSELLSSLSEACLRHVLSVENATERGWLNLDDLSDAIDKYSACHNNNNRPQAFS